MCVCAYFGTSLSGKPPRCMIHRLGSDCRVHLCPRIIKPGKCRQNTHPKKFFGLVHTCTGVFKVTFFTLWLLKIVPDSLEGVQTNILKLCFGLDQIRPAFRENVA